MTTKAEREAKEAKEAAEAEAAAQAAAAGQPVAGSPDEMIVIRHPDIKIPGVATRRALEGVYKKKGWSEDTSIKVDEVPNIIAKLKADKAAAAGK